ncbi:MAG: MotA/TolQ/ExbB proton channel family protein [bacterium]
MSGIWEMIIKGGVVMIPLFITSIAGLTVFLERIWFLRRKKNIDSETKFIIDSIESEEDVEKAINKLGTPRNSLQQIVSVTLENYTRPRDEIKEKIVDQGRQESGKMEKGLVVLETVAGIAPLMGLLGTVLGMIEVFQVITEKGLGQTQSLSSGISQALITTVVGLTIAIPALIAYNYLNHKVENLVLEIEDYSRKLLDRILCFREN